MVFPAIAAIGTAAAGAGTLIGSLRQPSQPQQQQMGLDPGLAALYSTRLAPGNTRLTASAQELAAATGLYGGTETILSKILGQSAYDQFKIAAQKDQLSSNLAAAIPAQYASETIANLGLQQKTNLAMQLLGAQTGADLAKTYAATQSQIQDRVLQGETSLLTPAVQMSAAINQDAAANRNLMAQNIASTNLDIRKSQQDTFNELAKQRAQVGGASKLQREQFGGQLALGQQETESKRVLQREQVGGQLALSQQSYESQSALDRQRFAQEMAKRQYGAGMAMARFFA